MTIPTLLCTASGRMIDLLHPNPRLIDFHDIAEHLAKEARFSGATPGVVYSVAEHCCRGTDALLARGERDAAAAFLIHDAPEAYLKDDPTPKKVAISTLLQECGVAAVAFADANKELERRFARTIHVAAGLVYPLLPNEDRAVKAMDRIMFATEWRDLMPKSVPCPLEAVPLEGVIKPWPWETAARAYMRRCEQLLPIFSGVLAHDKSAAEMGGASA